MRRAMLWCGALAVAISCGPAAWGKDLLQEVRQVIADYPVHPAPVEALRAGGQVELDRLFELRDELSAEAKAAAASPSKEGASQADAAYRKIAKLDELIDQVGKQRYCSRSRLFWHTDFNQARAAARKSGKPILSLRLLGNLDEDFSCANSRFFRTTLYANAEVSEALRSGFVLHWQSVRPVPKVTIDFGDGRVLHRTLTGNSIHYVLTPEGEVVDAIPGLYGPRAFLAQIRAGESIARRVAAMDANQRQEALTTYHAEQQNRLSEAFKRDLARLDTTVQNVAIASPTYRVTGKAVPTANEAAAIAAPKGRVERPLLAALPLSTDPDQLQDDSVWERIAALHAEAAKLDDASRQLIRSENPTAAQAGKRAMTKRIVEDPLIRLVNSLESSIALDTVKNEYKLHRQIHGWLARFDSQPSLDALNERVYAELFLTPSSDPWLGLAPADVYTALPEGGVAHTSK